MKILEQSDEMKAHLEMWRKLNMEEKMNWVFNQLAFDIKTGKWVKKDDL